MKQYTFKRFRLAEYFKIQDEQSIEYPPPLLKKKKSMQVKMTGVLLKN
jgi:hypothetical protein